MIRAGLIAGVAMLHLGFMALEIVFWRRPLGRRIFRQNEADAAVTARLAANQGLYNGFLAAGLFWSLVNNDPNCRFALQLFFLSCVMIAGVFGALTVSRRILFVQAAPALVATLVVLLD